MPEQSDIPRLGDILYFFDEDKQPHAAIVAHVHDRRVAGSDRPICNLAILKHDGRVSCRVEVEPAYDDGEKWRLVEKWSWPDEVPVDEYSHLPPPKFRRRKVGAGEYIPTH